jgi:hypothetical protein
MTEANMNQCCHNQYSAHDYLEYKFQDARSNV